MENHFRKWMGMGVNCYTILVRGKCHMGGSSVGRAGDLGFVRTNGLGNSKVGYIVVPTLQKESHRGRSLHQRNTSFFGEQVWQGEVLACEAG